MGHYTEVMFRGTVKRDIARFIVSTLEKPWVFEDYIDDETEYNSLQEVINTHVDKDILDNLRKSGNSDKIEVAEGNCEFFKTSRWPYVFQGVLGTFPESGFFDFVEEKYDRHNLINNNCEKYTDISFRSAIRNYTGEIEEFFEWITPFVKFDGFMGYSLSEFQILPTLYYIEDNELKVSQGKIRPIS